MSGNIVAVPRPRYRRRHYFVQKRLQGAFVARFIFGVLAAAAAAGGAVYVSVGSAIEQEMYSAHFSVARTGELLRANLIGLNLAVAIILMLLAVLVMIRTLRRCTMAFTRLRAGLERVATGDLSIRFGPKAGDRLEDLFEELNHTIAHIHGKVHAAQLAMKDVIGMGQPERAAALRQVASELRLEP
ncbi:MAG: methyl-accepting chemotaxis protein [Acidobacteria bacterium]|nr:methyl-accepting chemotaxis protein [Acidobacteriota bacterium]